MRSTAAHRCGNAEVVQCLSVFLTMMPAQKRSWAGHGQVMGRSLVAGMSCRSTRTNPHPGNRTQRPPVRACASSWRQPSAYRAPARRRPHLLERGRHPDPTEGAALRAISSRRSGAASLFSTESM